jgi:hypothetical protein
VFSIIDLAEWAPQIIKIRICKISRTNEATGLIILSPYSASEEHELVPQSWYPRR